MNHHITRRAFFAYTAMGAASAATGCATVAAQSSETSGWSPTLETYRDQNTGALVRRLTSSESQDQVIYQTHPMWVNGMDYLVFNSDRLGGGMKPHILESRTARIRPLSGHPIGDYVVARKTAAMYALRDNAIFAYDAVRAFHEGTPGKWVADWPKGVTHQGMFSLDANERVLYGGATFEPDKKWGIVALDRPRGWTSSSVTSKPIPRSRVWSVSAGKPVAMRRSACGLSMRPNPNRAPSTWKPTTSG